MNTGFQLMLPKMLQVEVKYTEGFYFLDWMGVDAHFKKFLWSKYYIKI